MEWRVKVTLGGAFRRERGRFGGIFWGERTMIYLWKLKII